MPGIKNGLNPNEPPNGHLPDPSQPHPSSKNSLRKIIIPPTSINRKIPFASQNPATILMFRLTRPSPAVRPAAAVGMVGAAGSVISCFPHELQYRVPELNGLPQPSQYMFLPPSTLATDQYYVPHAKMFQAPAPLHHPQPAEAPRRCISVTSPPSEVSLLRRGILNPTEKVTSSPTTRSTADGKLFNNPKRRTCLNPRT